MSPAGQQVAEQDAPGTSAGDHDVEPLADGGAGLGRDDDPGPAAESGPDHALRQYVGGDRLPEPVVCGHRLTVDHLVGMLAVFRDQCAIGQCVTAYGSDGIRPRRELGNAAGPRVALDPLVEAQGET